MGNSSGNGNACGRGKYCVWFAWVFFSGVRGGRFGWVVVSKRA